MKKRNVEEKVEKFNKEKERKKGKKGKKERKEEMKKSLKSSSGKIKAMIVIFTSMVLFGDYYAYDIPYAIKEEFREEMSEKVPGEDEFNYMFDWLYTVYRVPNVIVPMINGYINDKVRDDERERKEER